MRFDPHARIDRGQRVARALYLERANSVGGVHDLPLQIGDVDAVGIGDAEGSDPGGRQVEEQRRAEAAGANDEDARGQQPDLPFFTDLLEDQVASVALELIFAELHEPLSQTVEQRRRQIALREIRQYDDDRLARRLGPRADFERGGERGAGRDADRPTLAWGRFPRCLEGGFVADADDLVDQARVEDIRDEPGADPLDPVRAWRAAGQHGAVLGFDRNHLETGFAGFDDGADAGQRAAGADPAHDNIDRALGVSPNLLRRRAAMDLGIGRVLELLRNER